MSALRSATILITLVLSPLAWGEVVYQCASNSGHLLFSDRPCTASARSTRALHVALENLVAHRLSDADLLHLRAIDGRRARRTGPAVRGLPSTEAVRACEHARAELARHRALARRPHATSLLATGRELRAAVRRACH